MPSPAPPQDHQRTFASNDGNSLFVEESFETTTTLNAPPPTPAPTTRATPPAETSTLNGNQLANGRPRLAEYHPSFEAAAAIIFATAEQFGNVVADLKREGYQNEDIDRIRHALDKNARLKNYYPSVGPVACLGPSGAGKSSSINGIFQRSGLAVKDDSGERGTYLTHEYRAPLPGQLSRYHVVAPYYSEEQIESLVKKHAKVLLKKPEATEDDEDNEEGGGEEHTNESEESYDTALDFFHTVLRGRKGFKSEQAVQEYFEELDAEDYDEQVELLIGYIEEFINTRNLDDRKEIHKAYSEAQLAEVFKKVSRPRRTGGKLSAEPSPWPLIRCVQIHMFNDLLQSGIVLGDCPGVSDTNLTVVENTEDYVQRAGTVLIFQPVERIEKNPILDRNLLKCLKLHKEANTYLIVTKIDSKDRISSDDKEELSDAHRLALQAAEDRVIYLRDQKKQLLERRSSSVPEEFVDLTKQIDSMDPEIVSAEAMVNQVSIRIRNDNLKKSLCEKFRKLEKSRRAPDLQVLFISSTEHQKHLDSKAYGPPMLDKEATGFPALRELLYRIPVVGKMEVLTHMGTVRFPGLLHGVSNVLTKSRLVRKKNVDYFIRERVERYLEVMRRLAEGLSRIFAEHVQNCIRTSERKWLTKLEQLISGPGGWQKTIKAGPFLTFCRHEGHWKIRVNGTVKWISWNAEIQECFALDLAKAFNNMEDELDNIIKNTLSHVGDVFEELMRDLDGYQDFQGVDSTGFYSFIKSKRDDVQYDVAKYFGSLKTSVEHIRQTATTTFKEEQSYSARAMKPVYEACLGMQATEPKADATGAKKRKVTKGGKQGLYLKEVRAKFAGDKDKSSLLRQICELAKGDYDTECKEWLIECDKILFNGCNDIVEDFNRRFHVEDVKAEKNENAVERLKAAAQEALDIINGPFTQHLRECERFEAGEE